MYAGGAQGGVGLVIWDRPNVWSIKLTRFHGPKMVSCEIAADRKMTPLIGAYLPTSTLEHLPGLEEALTRFKDQDPIMLGEINGDIGQDHNLRSQKVADLLTEFGLVDLLHPF